MNIKVFTAFSGYDSQCLALQRLSKAYPDFSFDLVGWSEFDPDSKQPIDKQPAVIAHKALFPQWADNNYGDVSKIDWNQVPDFDLFTYSFPCQDISVAGLQRGFDEGSGTRSGMLWECEKCIKAKRPKYLLLENVKALTSKRNRPNFQKWLDLLSGYGYSNYWQVLNAKNYGVPQNRERVFVVSILGEEGWYRFPSSFPLALRLKDILEENVDERYYLKANVSNYIQVKGSDPQVLTAKRTEFGKQVRKAYENHNEYYHRKELQEYVPREDGVSNILTSVQKDNMLAEPMCVASRGRPNEDGGNSQNLEMNKTGCTNTLTSVQKDNLVVEPVVIGSTQKNAFVGPVSGVSPTLTSAMGMGGGHVPMVEEPPTTTICLNSKVGGKQPSVASRVYDPRGVGVAVTTGWITNVASNYRIRKLTERECFRLMGLDEESIDIIKSTGISKSKQYALAGNSIVVDVLYYIFKNLFIGEEENRQEVEDNTPLTRIGNIYGPDRGTGFVGNVWDKEGLCPTLTTMEGGNRQPLITEDETKPEEGRLRVELPSSTSRQLMLEFVSALTNS